MAAGVTYEVALAALGAHPLGEKLNTYQIPYLLGQLGVATRIAYPPTILSGERMMCVRGHFVIVLHDDIVLDPARGPGCSLSDAAYDSPFCIWELHRVCEAA